MQNIDPAIFLQQYLNEFQFKLFCQRIVLIFATRKFNIMHEPFPMLNFRS